MAVVFDSVTYDRPDTLAAARVVFQEQSAPSTVEFDTAGGLSVVMEAWELGSAAVFRASMSGHRLVRSARDVRSGPAGKVAFAVQERGVARFEQFGVRRIVRPGELMVVDLDAPYEFGWPGPGSSRCVHVPAELLRMSHAEIARAAAALGASPLYDVVRCHIGELCIGRDDEVSAAAGESLGAATVALGRALLGSSRPGPA